MYTSGWPKNQNRCCQRNGHAPAGDVEDLRAQVPVGEQQGERRGQHREGQEGQHRRDQHVPGVDRHPEHGHARGAQAEDRRHDVDGGGDGGQAGEEESDDPQVGAGARRVHGVGQRGVGDPREGGGPAGDEEAGHDGDPAEEEHPVREGVQAGERHVGRPHLQRHEVVGQPEAERGGEQVHHDRAVEGEDGVVVLLVEHGVRRPGQLGADEQGEHAGQAEEDERRDDVALADHLVVGGGQPLQQPGPLGLLLLRRWRPSRALREASFVPDPHCAVLPPGRSARC